MRSSAFVLVLVCMSLAACENKVGSQDVAKFESGKVLSELTDNKLNEASGLAASVTNDGLLWTLNDKGNEAEIYLVDKNLKINMTVRLDGIDNRDWEDIVVGPGPDANLNYIYVGDIGDNDGEYKQKYIYRFPEPKVGEDKTITDFDKIVFTLEDGAKDSESLFIDAKSKNLYVVTKREKPVSVYELKYPQPVGETATASKVLSLSLNEIVSADCFGKKGDILMKNYKNIYYWENSDNLDVISLLKTKPQEVAYKAEPQGESIAWAADGSGFFTLSEKKKKEASYLYFYPKK